MNFTKGAILGIIAGTVVGVMNKDGIMGMINKGQKEMRKMKRRYGM